MNRIWGQDATDAAGCAIRNYMGTAATSSSTNFSALLQISTPLGADRLRELFIRVEGQLIRYPAIHGPLLRERVIDFCDAQE
jgi:hypothetical protein